MTDKDSFYIRLSMLMKLVYFLTTINIDIFKGKISKLEVFSVFHNKSGIKLAAIQSWFKNDPRFNDRIFPSEKTRDKIVEALGINDNWLKKGTGPMFLPGSPLENELLNFLKGIGLAIQPPGMSKELTEEKALRVLFGDEVETDEKLLKIIEALRDPVRGLMAKNEFENALIYAEQKSPGTFGGEAEGIKYQKSKKAN